MTQFVYPALHALFIWWFSTGLLIYLDGLPRRTFRWTMLGSTLLLVLALIGLAATGEDRSVSGAYQAFTYGLLAWAWLEVSFYLGYVTGVRKQACPEGCSGWRHFGHAVQACLWHELGILAVAAAVIGLTWGAPNQVGTWTFLVLWWMHQSARVNVFLGVRNLNEEFLPEHLAFLRSFFRKAPMNLLFPVSVTISTIIAAMLFRNAFAPEADAAAAAGYTFVGTLMVLAILEHWFLVLPLPAAALWSWSLRSHRPAHSFDVEVVAGFLGAGKTSLLRRRIDKLDPDARMLVLVNDPEALHFDAAMLTGGAAQAGRAIVLPMERDLSKQIRRAVERWAPQRVMIEPAGGADLGALLALMARVDLKPMVGSLHVTAVIDAGAFLRDYARMQRYFETQVTLAQTVVVNKIDVVAPAGLRMVTSTVLALNPAAQIVAASHGMLQPGFIGPHTANAKFAGFADETDGAEPPGESLPDVEAQADTLGFTTCSIAPPGRCDPQLLLELLDHVVAGAFGRIERLKGIVRAGAGWVRFDCAGGRPQIAAAALDDDEMPRVVVVGLNVDRIRLQSALAACAKLNAQNERNLI